MPLEKMDIDLYIRITASILGITYPILLQVIARLDEKYASAIIVELFDTEKPKKVFRTILIIALVSIAFRSIIPILPIQGEIKYWTERTADLIVFITSFYLVVSFFYFVEKILVYYTPLKFVDLLKRKYDKTDDIRYFNALSDIFTLALQKQNIYLTETLSRIFQDAFNNERIRQDSKKVIYPQAYYSLVYKATEELALQKSKRNKRLEVSTVGGGWLLGDNSTHDVSDETYEALWANLRLAIKYEQDDMIISFWENANRFYTFSMGAIRKEYGEFKDDRIEILNEEVVKKNQDDRKRFLEFNYALGGLLLYKERYKCIDRIFQYTPSQPPEYVLLPEYMSEIFEQVVRFRDQYDNYYVWISSRYPFPEQSGIRADDVIKLWICKYFSVLFLRQYTLQIYYTYSNPLGLPMIPKEQSEKRELINSLEFFRKIVTESLNNAALIKELYLEFITEDWSRENKKIHPLDFISNLEKALNDAYEDTAINQPISQKKIENFFTKSREIIENTFNNYNSVKNTTLIKSKFNSLFVNGTRMVENKDTFSDNPEVHHLNYDTILASSISDNFKSVLAFSFSRNRSKYYLIEPEDIFHAIDKLSIDNTYIIVSIGFNVDSHIYQYKTLGLSTNEYKTIKIEKLYGGHNRNSLFILKQIDLPNIISNELKEDTITNYSLEKISDTLNLYASVLDLNTVDQEIRDENSQNISEDELRKSVLLNLFQSTEIRFKENIKLIQIAEYSRYDQEGTPNDLDDIQSISDT